ncbi:N-acetyltransferase family protein [Streptomyces tubercidicus]|uniref:N-acetyltransferase domain-containing protein n=1 Tax=Streptomyces tubercidicus TaxID=47759 RepID=A0A640ULQ4_9ACTN|nr:GNAT family N-acetyltransferase [Streptomyces tubercidicus]WAU11658.1 GNAT family N-acetyltransferase [Streptomyces tubercidicus]GFE36963.1 hypothetical protein Stube_16360 [Streptomyces tubercidicus]
MQQTGNQQAWSVSPATEGDYAHWRKLYQGYADFYGKEMPESRAERVWSWIMNPEHEVHCILVRDEAGAPVGLAHYRPFARPLTATTGGFLDDLFVTPELRGSGAVDALFTRLREITAERGWSVLRWITMDDNYRARSKYDRVAQQTKWVTYDMAPSA